MSDRPAKPMQTRQNVEHINAHITAAEIPTTHVLHEAVKAPKGCRIWDEAGLAWVKQKRLIVHATPADRTQANQAMGSVPRLVPTRYVTVFVRKRQNWVLFAMASRQDGQDR